MKKLVAIIAVFYSLISFAQTNTFPSTGNAGIGTTSPQTKFHLLNNTLGLSSDNFITIENRGSNTSGGFTNDYVVGGILFAGFNTAGNPANIGAIWAHRWPSSSGANSLAELSFGLTDNGQNISTDNVLPTERMRLTCGKGLWLNGSLINSDNARPALSDNVASEIRGVSKTGQWMDDGFLRLSAGGGTDVNAKSYIDLSGYTINTNADRYKNIVMGTAGVERLRINADGTIGINTVDTKGYQLAVNGNVIVTKLVVRKYENWADYVFDSSYKLASLNSLEEFIKKYKHLPGIPTAEEVSSNGIDIADNQAALLQKTEELTLYIIDLNKKIEEQQKLIKKLLEQSQLQQKQIELLTKQ